ncbi:efflux RND transporter periplasmic adaptor subunit [Shewanella sp. 10N.286.45.A1]|uniref:efflux RND transporter periplasmic adaptor subunit n=1 Tax=Shewanella sp. 10N.286.45.A1 TaxID=3229694 RepID=UPI003554702B
MDIVRQKKQPLFKSRSNWLILAVTCLLLVIGLFVNRNDASFRVNEGSILADRVQRGDMEINIRGNGVLVPEDIRWIATDTAGRVERIYAKAGAVVQQGDLLLELSNPLLVQQLEEDKWELEALTAQTKAEIVAMESALLDLEAAVVNEKLNWERAMLTLKAHNKLLEQGVNIVSKIALAEIKIDVEQSKKRWQLEQRRLAKQQQNLAAQKVALQARLKRMHRVVQRSQVQVDNLNVRATMDSVVQEMSIQLGQQVNVGASLAKLARNDRYIAELQIPEKQIKDVALGQKVTIDTRSNQITGVVNRIDLAVINSSVKVDVTLTGKLPAEARPDLTVDGVIEVAHITDALYVKRPIFVKSNTLQDIYLVDETGNFALKKKVKFGLVSARYAQIEAGLKQGETIIVSDASSWKEHSKVLIN